MRIKTVILILSSVLLAACSKMEDGAFRDDASYAYPADETEEPQGRVLEESFIETGTLAIGPEGKRALSVEKQLFLVYNLESIKKIPNGTAVVAEYSFVIGVPVSAGFDDVVYIRTIEQLSADEPGWADGMVSSDPVDIVADAFTSASSGYLNIHYRCPMSGTLQHEFRLQRGSGDTEYYFIHDSKNDDGTILQDGICTFSLPGTLVDGAKIQIHYLSLSNTSETFTIEYSDWK